MSPNSRRIAILLAMWPMAVMAQQQPDPANPAASGRPVAYVSVFASDQTAPETAQASPDKSWILHNRQMMPVPKATATAPAPAAAPPPPAHQHGNRGQGS
ncbi:hypothetical protein [Lacisediminimonas sp.]|uniref:hypothetical protein n=1 Tax=Lacisediminimonas sp. TaxID=3060582 RepID=UPI00272C57C4|nr:hypothetical protein [Lacisediminimonas sp.]